MFTARLRKLTEHGPHLPRHAFGLERPTVATFLEELETYGPPRRRRGGVDRPEKVRELRYLPLHVPPKEVRLAAHVGEVNEIAVHVHVTDCAYGITLLAVVREFAARAVKEDRVEDASNHLVDLPTLHRQLKGYRAGVHGAGVTGPSRALPLILLT